MVSISGKIVFVAGANNIVGKSVCAAIGAAGGKVFAVGDPGCGSQVSVSPMDDGAWANAFSRCREVHGRIDAVVNARHRSEFGQIAATTPDAFAQAYNDHAIASWLIQKHAVLALRQSGGGAIVIVTSVLGRVAGAGAAAASAAARGILMSSKSAALECARNRDGIVVNAVLAGRIEGDPTHWPDGRLLPAAHPVTPSDVADSVMFYLTDGAAYMTGSELPVDAGFLAA